MRIYIYIYILGTLEQSGTENYTQRLDIIQSLCKLRQFYFSDFLRPKCLNTPIQKYVPGRKIFQYPQIIYNLQKMNRTKKSLTQISFIVLSKC